MKTASRTMSEDYVRSIAERSLRTVARRVFWITLVVTLIVGALAALHYASAQLTLSHYDARAHLVVARRVIDSLTPGWRQFGSVWLPLPHIANLVPSAWDWSYQTGAAAVARWSSGRRCNSPMADGSPMNVVRCSEHGS